MNFFNNHFIPDNEYKPLFSYCQVSHSYNGDSLCAVYMRQFM